MHVKYNVIVEVQSILEKITHLPKHIFAKYTSYTVLHKLIILCSQNFMVKTSNSYLCMLTNRFYL